MLTPETCTAVLELHFFGQPEIRVCECDVTPSLSKRSIWLLAILALREGNPIERNRLAGMLWPDSTEESALHNLRQTLAMLRKVLGPARDLVATVSPRSLFLDLSKVFVDVLAFDAACREGSPWAKERAINLYRDSLLLGCDEPFVTTWRSQRATEFLDNAESLVQRHASSRNYAAAVNVLRRILVEDPYRESACLALMKGLAEMGEASAALDQCREFRSMLRRERHTDISSDTKDLYKKIRAGVVKDEPNELRRRVPSLPNELVGRGVEIATIRSLLDRCRLVTLSGAGGVGKTRLALAVADHLGRQFMDGAWFADLAPIVDGGNVAMTIARSMNIHEEAARSITETIANAIRERELILVVDNCEHLAEPVAALLDMLLSECPGLRVVATSRQSLGVSGEAIWRVPSLGMPEEWSAEAIARCDAVRLFLVRSGLEGNVEDSELESIASICERLDGLPLAIELAAARTSALTFREIEEGLSDRFALLTSGSRTLARHQTLQASIQWSWEMLSDEERNVLMCLSVFRGGCTLAAIEAVAKVNAVADILSILIDRSLVTSRKERNETRFHLLETIREFADKQLQDSSGWRGTHDRHRDYFLALSDEGRAHMEMPGEKEWFDRFEREHDNLRAAISWCRTQQHNDERLRFSIALSRFWDTCGHVSEGREHIESALLEETPGLSRRSLASAHIHAGWMATVQRDTESAIQHYELALPFFREEGDLRSVARGLTCLGSGYHYSRDYASAKRVFEEAIEVCGQLNLPVGVAMNHSNLAEMYLEMGENSTARKHIEQSIALIDGYVEEKPEPCGQIIFALSLTDLREGLYKEARTHALEALRIFHDASLVVNIPGTLQQLGIVQAAFREWESAAKLLSACEVLAASTGAPLIETLSRDHKAVLAEAKISLGPAAFESAISAGKFMSVDDAVAHAFSCQDNQVRIA